MPLATVPSSYVVGIHSTRHIEEPTYIYIAAADPYCSDFAAPVILYTTTQRVPLIAIPACYVACAHSTRYGELTTYIHIVATDRYRIHTFIFATITHTTTQRMPLTAVPTSYVVGAHFSGRGELPTHIHVRAANCYRIGIIIYTRQI